MTRLQREDEEIGKLIQEVTKGNEVEGKLGRIAERCVFENEILYYKPGGNSMKVIYLPETLREEIIKQVHLEMGHQGAYKIIKYIRDRFFWRGLTRQIKQWTRTCTKCQLTKHNTINMVGPCRSIVSEEVGDLVMADLYGPLPTGRFGMNYILVIQDSFSKFVKLYELRRATATTVLGRIKKFMEIIKPKIILTDKWTQFSSKLWKEYMREQGIRVTYTTVRNPRPNTTERVNKELGRLFRTYCSSNHKGWVSVLPKLEYTTTLIMRALVTLRAR